MGTHYHTEVLAGIISYNPSLVRLRKNVEAIVSQVNEIIVIDNASDNQNQVEKQIKELCDTGMIVHLIKNSTNQGLGNALNHLFKYAKEQHFGWVIMLDQDSIIPADYIDKASRYFKNGDIGIICTSYYEKNSGKIISKEKNGNERLPYIYVHRCITSASVVRVEAYRKTKGFDEEMFVDYVDFDFSMKMRKAGYKILKMNDTMIEHELGVSKKQQLAFWRFRLTTHSAQREYWIARNIVVFIYRYHKDEPIIRDFLSLCKHFIIILIYERDYRWEKLRALCKGVRDGFKLLR